MKQRQKQTCKELSFVPLKRWCIHDIRKDAIKKELPENKRMLKLKLHQMKILIERLEDKFEGIF